MTEMPRYNPAPDAFAPQGAPTPPPIMNTIFAMLMGAAALSVVATIMGVIAMQSDKFRQQVADQLANQNIPGDMASVIDTTITFAMVGSIVFAAVAVIAYVVVGIFIKKGMGWARMVGAILAVASLSQLFGMTMPAGALTIVQVLAGIAAMVLCFTGAGAAFFAAKKDYRLATKGR